MSVRYKGTLCLSIKRIVWALIIWKIRKGGGIQFGRQYTPLSENDIKKTQIKSMETTVHFQFIYKETNYLNKSICLIFFEINFIKIEINWNNFIKIDRSRYHIRFGCNSPASKASTEVGKLTERKIFAPK